MNLSLYMHVHVNSPLCLCTYTCMHARSLSPCFRLFRSIIHSLIVILVAYNVYVRILQWLQMSVCSKQSIELHKEAVDNLHTVVDSNVKVYYIP